MAETTAISWCDRTWSPWRGCTQVSLGDHGACVGCYARHLDETRFHRVVFGGPERGEGTRDFRPDAAWKEPLRWEREAAASKQAWFAPGGPPDGGMGKPWPYSPFVFPSMCDPFDNHPAVREERRRFFDLIRATPHLTWLLLTKRPQNIVRQFVEAFGGDPASRIGLEGYWPRNAAIGFTAVTQPEMDRDGRHALAAFEALQPPFLFWSGEPLMEHVDIPPELLALGARFWAITGGETNQGKHRARPSHPDWFRDLREQCADAGVPFHFKQWGEWIPGENAGGPQTRTQEGADLINGEWFSHRYTPSEGALLTCEDEPDVWRVGKKTAGRLLDGVLHDARPEAR